jgi:1-pyrroline-4-hydroxy-2-carboxylate deaminase
MRGAAKLTRTESRSKVVPTSYPSAMKWQGVIPAITTPFEPDLSVDADLLVKQVDALVRAGCAGIVALGSLGEGGSLSFDEKKAVLRLCREALAGRAPLVAGVAALTTAEAVRLAELGKEARCDGLMILPPYVYRGDWRETRAHFDAVIGATPLPCMLYNNPIAYGTDVLPEQVLDLAATLPNLVAIKESSADVRRVTSLRALLGDRLAILVGVDDLVLEGIQAGAVGWIAGLADALPAESVRLFDLAAAGRIAEARAIYDWFLPLLRLDTVPKFVQLIKLVQQETGLGSEAVRPPRLPLASPEREAVVELVRYVLARRPV